MKDVSLIFTEEELKILDMALRKLPYEVVVKLIGKINQQIEVQLAIDNTTEPNTVS